MLNKRRLSRVEIVIERGALDPPRPLQAALRRRVPELPDANGTLAMNDNWHTTQLGGIITSDQSV